MEQILNKELISIVYTSIAVIGLAQNMYSEKKNLGKEKQNTLRIHKGFFILDEHNKDNEHKC